MLSFLTLERKQKNSSNAYRIRIFLFRSYSFGIETITTFIHSRSSLENHNRFQTTMGKVYTRFQTKTAQRNPTGTYLDSLYKGVPPRFGYKEHEQPLEQIESQENQQLNTTVRVFSCFTLNVSQARFSGVERGLISRTAGTII